MKLIVSIRKSLVAPTCPLNAIPFLEAVILVALTLLLAHSNSDYSTKCYKLIKTGHFWLLVSKAKMCLKCVLSKLFYKQSAETCTNILTSNIFWLFFILDTLYIKREHSILEVRAFHVMPWHDILIKVGYRLVALLLYSNTFVGTFFIANRKLFVGY